MFYKEGRKEEVTCRAARVAADLAQQRRIPHKRLSASVKDPKLWLKHKITITREVCRQCLFMKADCDFQSQAPSEDLEPCGGYVVLACLLENQDIEFVEVGNSK